MSIISNFKQETFKLSDIPDASESNKGIVQLSNDLSSTSQTLAATPKSAKITYEKIKKSESSIPKSKVTVNGLSGTSFTISNGTDSVSGSIDSTGSTTVEISGLGEYNVTGNYNGKNITTTLNIDKIGSYSIDLYDQISFADDSYELISKISKSGKAPSIYSVGDTKAVILNGNAETLSFNNNTVYVQILAFNHNGDIEMNGEHHIVCGFGKMSSSGVDTCFIDEYYGKQTVPSAYINMNTTGTNSGGWQNSRMRTVICAAFQNTLPSDLQAVLRSRRIYSENIGGDVNTEGEYYTVTATTDTVYIPSEFEIYGVRTRANIYEQNYQRQLMYYIYGNSKIRYGEALNSNTMNRFWWLRSVDHVGTISFCAVGRDGKLGSVYAMISGGFFPLITI